jgi:hypothetical protein
VNEQDYTESPEGQAALEQAERDHLESELAQLSAPVVAEVRRAPIDLEGIQRRALVSLHTRLAPLAKSVLSDDIPDLLAEVARLTAELKLSIYQRDWFMRATNAEADLEALRIRLRGLEQQWRPIETLKGDEWYGRSILVWVPFDNAGDVKRCSYMVYLDSDKRFRLWSDSRGDELFYRPTHWMPTPTPPDELARLLTTPEEP